MNDATCQNTDRELWRKSPGDAYSPSIHVTKGGGIGINVAGHTVVMPVERWHALGMIERGFEKAPSEQRHTPASLLDWAETLLCDPANRLSPLYLAKQWRLQVKAWRDAKNALPPHSQPTVSPTPDPPARDQSVYCNFPEPASVLDEARNLEITRAALEHSDQATQHRGIVYHAFAAGAKWALELQRSCEPIGEGIQAFQATARVCSHAAYLALPEPRPRHCPTCGTCMWDAGD